MKGNLYILGEDGTFIVIPRLSESPLRDIQSHVVGRYETANVVIAHFRETKLGPNGLVFTKLFKMRLEKLTYPEKEDYYMIVMVRAPYLGISDKRLTFLETLDFEFDNLQRDR